jgi:ATP-dependent metalloprotease
LFPSFCGSYFRTLGKTLLAKAVAGEAEVPFFYASGSEFEEMYVGLGAKRVRELFKAAREFGKCIVFIDEIDAIGGTRKMRDSQSMRMTLNQLLIELDGFSQNDDIIIIGATNFPELLDPALIRPGRFDKQVVVAYPDVKGRKDIIELYLKKVKSGNDVNAEVLARGTPGCSGADLANIVNIAAIESAIRRQKFVTMEMLEYAKDRVLMGAERKSSVLSPEVKKTTAFHEGGHAIVAVFTEGSMPIHKATIIPRGSSLGMVMRLPETDRLSQSKKELLADLDVAMGGRVAEEMIFGHDSITTGASSDIANATRIARAMVLQYGMSELVGPVQRSAQELSSVGPKTHAVIDSEVHRLIDESYQRVKQLLALRKPELEKLANSLLEHETLTGDEILQLLNVKKTKQ